MTDEQQHSLEHERDDARAACHEWSDIVKRLKGEVQGLRRLQQEASQASAHFQERAEQAEATLTQLREENEQLEVSLGRVLADNDRVYAKSFALREALETIQLELKPAAAGAQPGSSLREMLHRWLSITEAVLHGRDTEGQ